MKPDGPTKLLIRDDEGVVVAYTRDGTVYDVMSGERIAKLRAGQLYTADDQLLGICLPSGKVRGVGGEPAAAFMKLIRREALTAEHKMAPMRNLVNFERHVAFKPTVVVWNALASVRRTAYAR